MTSFAQYLMPPVVTDEFEGMSIISNHKQVDVEPLLMNHEYAEIPLPELKTIVLRDLCTAPCAADVVQRWGISEEVLQRWKRQARAKPITAVTSIKRTCRKSRHSAKNAA